MDDEYLEIVASAFEAGNSVNGIIKAYIIRNTNKDFGMYFGSLNKISKETNTSKSSVKKVINSLRNNGLIKMYRDGVWMIHPIILFNCNCKKYKEFLSDYNSI